MKKSPYKKASFEWSLNPEIDIFTYDEIIELFLNRKTIENQEQEHKLEIFKTHFEKAKRAAERMAKEIYNQGLASWKVYLHVHFGQNFDLSFEISLRALSQNYNMQFYNKQFSYTDNLSYVANETRLSIFYIFN